MSGLSMTGRCSFVQLSLIPSYVPWTEPLPPSAPPGGALHTVLCLHDTVDVLQVRHHDAGSSLRLSRARQCTRVGVSASLGRDALCDWQR